MTVEERMAFKKLVHSITDEVELKSCYQLLKAQQRTIRAEAAEALRPAFAPGTKVYFEDRQGRVHNGEVKTINRTTANVDVGGLMQWRVALSYLRVQG